MTARKPKVKTERAAKVGGSRAGAAARRDLFVQHYIANGGNATQAAISAGYAPKSAKQTGHEVLTHPDVTANITEHRNRLREKTGLTTERVAQELAKLVFSDPRKLVDEEGRIRPLHELEDEVAGSLASIEVFEEFEGRGDQRVKIGETKKVKLWDKNAAIEKAMKHLGMFEQDNTQKQPILIFDEKDMGA